jgi:hypothetical protein
MPTGKVKVESSASAAFGRSCLRVGSCSRASQRLNAWHRLRSGMAPVRDTLYPPTPNFCWDMDTEVRNAPLLPRGFVGAPVAGRNLSSRPAGEPPAEAAATPGWLVDVIIQVVRKPREADPPTPRLAQEVWEAWTSGPTDAIQFTRIIGRLPRNRTPELLPPASPPGTLNLHLISRPVATWRRRLVSRRGWVSRRRASAGGYGRVHERSADQRP